MRLRRSSPHEPGWRRVRRGRGFSYLDQDGAALGAAELERVRALVIPPAWTDVWICSAANGHLQCVGTDEAGRRQYLYHPRWRERQDEAKFARVREMARELPRVRQQICAVLEQAESPVSREVALATAVRLVDLGCFRLGDDSYTDLHGSHGLTTLECRHVSWSKQVVAFEFLGKSGVEQVVEVTDPDVCRVVGQLTRSRRGSSKVLAYRDGRRWVPVDAAMVNDTVRELFHAEVTAKDFRTWHATVQVAAELGRVDPATSVTGRAKQVREAVKSASELLGNTPSVAKGSYVDPRVIDLFENGRTIRATVARLHRDPRKAQDQLDRAVRRLLVS